MKKQYKVIAPRLKNILVCCFLLLNVFGFAQQNFINVPSCEPTAKGKVFFQQQVNLANIFQSNTTFDFGLKKKFEAGFNLLNLDYKTRMPFVNEKSADPGPVNPLILFNCLKQFRLTEKTFLIAGTQIGRNYRFKKNETGAALIYTNYSVHDILIPNSNIIVGGFYNTRSYGGPGNRFGGWIGSEFTLYHKLHFIAESIFGNNNMSYTSVGLVYFPVKRVPLTFGIQIPNARANSYAFVFELTIIP